MEQSSKRRKSNFFHSIKLIENLDPIDINNENYKLKSGTTALYVSKNHTVILELVKNDYNIIISEISSILWGLTKMPPILGPSEHNF